MRFFGQAPPGRHGRNLPGASEALPCVRLEVLVLGGHFRRISDMLIPLAECRTAPLCRPYPCRIPLQKGAHPCTWAAPCFALPHRGQGYLIKRAETETSRLSGRSGRRPRFFLQKAEMDWMPRPCPSWRVTGRPLLSKETSPVQGLEISSIMPGRPTILHRISLCSGGSSRLA